jgi:hypothetical protein
MCVTIVAIHVWIVHSTLDSAAGSAVGPERQEQSLRFFFYDMLKKSASTRPEEFHRKFMLHFNSSPFSENFIHERTRQELAHPSFYELSSFPSDLVALYARIHPYELSNHLHALIQLDSYSTRRWCPYLYPKYDEMQEHFSINQVVTSRLQQPESDSKSRLYQSLKDNLYSSSFAAHFFNPAIMYLSTVRWPEFLSQSTIVSIRKEIALIFEVVSHSERLCFHSTSVSTSCLFCHHNRTGFYMSIPIIMVTFLRFQDAVYVYSPTIWHMMFRDMKYLALILCSATLYSYLQLTYSSQCSEHSILEILDNKTSSENDVLSVRSGYDDDIGDEENNVNRELTFNRYSHRFGKSFFNLKELPKPKIEVKYELKYLEERELEAKCQDDLEEFNMRLLIFIVINLRYNQHLRKPPPVACEHFKSTLLVNMSRLVVANKRAILLFLELIPRFYLLEHLRRNVFRGKEVN